MYATAMQIVHRVWEAGFVQHDNRDYT